GLADLLEALLGLAVAGIAVGMIRPGEVAVGLLQRGVVGVAGNPEDAVIILGRHATNRSPRPDRREPSPRCPSRVGAPGHSGESPGRSPPPPSCPGGPGAGPARPPRGAPDRTADPPTRTG